MCDSENGSEKYKNENFNNNLIQRLYELYSQERMCDVSLLNKDKSYKAHSVILMASSEYFNNLFSDKSVKSVELDNISNDSLNSIIQYCYTGEIRFKPETVVDTVSAAGFLEITFIIKSGCEFMISSLNPDNCLQFEEIASSYNHQRLHDSVNEFIMKNFVKITETPKFLKISFENLKKYLELEINAAELDIFAGVKKWIQHDRTNRVKNLSALLRIIKIPTLSTQTIFDQVQPLCEDNSDCQVVLFQALQWKQFPGRRSQITGTNWDVQSTEYTIIVAGSLHGDVSSVIDIYNPTNRTWSEYMDIDHQQTNAAWIKIGDELYIIGGIRGSVTNRILKVNIRTGHKENFRSMNAARHKPAVAVVKNIIFAFGGQNGDEVLNTVEKWDPILNKWEFTTPMPTPRVGCGIAVIDNEIYLMGGWYNRVKDGKVDYDALNTMEAFCPFTGRWRTCAPMKYKRDWTTATVFNKKIYVFGGRPGEYSFGEATLKTCEVYDPTTNTWEDIADMNFILYGTAAGVLRDNIYVAGGADGYRAVNNFQKYNVASNRWEDLPAMIRSRENGFMFTVPVSFLNKKFPKI